jgi:hypothetical protein
MNKKFSGILLLLLLHTLVAQSASEKVIKIHFLYGSRPAKGYKNRETKWFGGLKGGHVSIEVDAEVIGFVPVEGVHIFPKQKKNSRFVVESLPEWQRDTATLKYTTISIPVTDQQYEQIKQIHQAYCQQPPYDYAFFGMRCAAATNEILSQLGITKSKTKCGFVVSTFYPQLLRRRLLWQAEISNWPVHRQAGRVSRKWEKE